MAKRMPIALFVQELVAALNRKDGYIMASYGQNPRTGYLDLSVPDSKCKSSWKENGWYYAQYSGDQRTAALAWRKKCTRVWDCNGMAEGIYEIWSGVCINARARNNYAGWCGVKGKGLIPAKYRVPGAAVFWGSSASSIHHVAYLYKPVKPGDPSGDWYIIEARGVKYGVVKTKLLSRSPNFWGLMDKYFDYSGEAVPETPHAPALLHEVQAPAAPGWNPEDSPGLVAPAEGSGATAIAETVIIAPTLGSRILRNGAEGADVREMQAGLIRLGYDLGRYGADGDFGDCTELAVRQFQQDGGLEVDGEFGPKSLAVFEGLLADLDKPKDAPRYVVIEGGNCYVRSGPGTGSKAIGVAMRGEKLPFDGVIDEETRWLLVQFSKKGEAAPVNGWVSPKYGRLAE